MMRSTLPALMMAVLAGHCLVADRALASDNPGAVVLDPQMQWQPGPGDDMPAVYEIQKLSDGSLRAEVGEPGESLYLTAPIGAKLDIDRTPILVMKYKGVKLDTQPADRIVLTFRTCGRGFSPVRMNDLTVDGEEHTLRLDLRGRLAKFTETCGGQAPSLQAPIMLRIASGAQGQAQFDLIDLRFEPAENARLPQIQSKRTAAPVRVRVVDSEGAPIENATVTLDEHLRYSKRSVQTDANGEATLQPDAALAPVSRDVLRVTKDGLSSVLFTDLSRVDGTTLQATLYPTVVLGGQLLNDDGQPIVGAVGELLMDGVNAPGDPGQPQSFTRAAVVTDEQGRWTSPPVPDSDRLRARVRWTDGHNNRPGRSSEAPSLSELRDGTAVQTLRRQRS